MMLSRRQIEILMDFYTRQDTYIILKTIAEKQHISLRTVQTCISIIKDEIKSHGMELRSTSAKGCILLIKNEQEAKQYISAISKEYTRHYFFDDQTSRVHFILSKLLHHTGFIKSQALADQMYISRSRMSDDLLIVKKLLAKYHLSLISKPYYGCKIEGEELNKRQCLIKENLIADTSIFTNLITDNNSTITKVKDMLIPLLLKNHYHISDIALQNLIIHIVTAVDRIQKHNSIQMSYLRLDESYHHVVAIAKEIMEECHQGYSS